MFSATTLRRRVSAVAALAVGMGLLAAAPASAAATASVQSGQGTRAVASGSTSPVTFKIDANAGDQFKVTVASGGVGSVGTGTFLAPQVQTNKLTTASVAYPYTFTRSGSDAGMASVTVPVSVGNAADGHTFTVSVTTTGGSPLASATLTVDYTLTGGASYMDTPFYVTIPDTATGNNTATTEVDQIASTGGFVEITATNNTMAYSGDDLRYLQITGGTFKSKTSSAWTSNLTDPTLTDGATIMYAPASGAITDDAFRIKTEVAGTITVKFIKRTYVDGVATNTTTQTIYIYVDNAPYRTYSHATAVTAVGARGYEVTSDDGSKNYFAPKAASLTASLGITVEQWGNAAGTQRLLGSAKKVTATLTGVGVLSSSGGTVLATASYLEWAASTTSNANAYRTIYVHADGRAGTGTVVITVDGVTIATKTVKFYGAVSKLNVTVNHNYIAVGANTSTFTVEAVDALGTAIPGLALTAVSGSPLVAAPTAAGTTGGTLGGSVSDAVYGLANFNVDGRSKGAFTVTFGDAAETVSATATANVTGSQIADIKWAFDKASYALGEKAKITFTAKDSDGKPVADGAYVLFAAAPVASAAILTAGGSVLGTSVTFKDGTKTLSYYMPASAGTVVVSGVLAANVQVAAALQGAATSISATVTDAAFDAIKAQVASLTTTVTAIQTAIATLVASTTATLTTLTSKINKIMKKLKIK